MSKVLKNFRFDQETIEKLEKLVELHQSILDESTRKYHYAVKKKVTMTDVIELLIRKEYDFQDFEQEDY